MSDVVTPSEERHQHSGRAGAYGPAATGETHHLSTAVSEVRETQLQDVSHRPGAWPVLVCLLARRDTPTILLYWQETCAAERDRSVEIPPDCLHLHVRLIHVPGGVAGFEMRPTAFFQFRGRALNPALARRVVDVQSAFQQHLFEVAVAERRTSGPAPAEQDDLGFEMVPWKRRRVVHKREASQSGA